jgi:hypothetical protein
MTDASGWETIAEEAGTLVKWETPPETFIGIYEGTRHIVPNDSDDPEDEFDQQMFRSDKGTGPGEDLYVMNGGYKVRDALTDEKIGWLIKLDYLRDIPTGQPSPMRDIKVSGKAPGTF